MSTPLGLQKPNVPDALTRNSSPRMCSHVERGICWDCWDVVNRRLRFESRLPMPQVRRGATRKGMVV